MANLAELQCFNKLLLEKMERMKIQHKKEMHKFKMTYESLWDVTIDGDEYVEMGLIHYCGGCERWFNCNDEGTKGNCDCFKCDTCKHDENTGIYDCYKCEEPICRDCNEFKMFDCCKECYLLEQYPLVDSRVFREYHSVVYDLRREFRKQKNA